MIKTKYALLIGMMLVAPVVLPATELVPETTKGWDQYIQKTNAEMQLRLSGRTPFLWIDQAPDRRERLRRGEILAEPGCDGGEAKVPHGLVHHWIGAVFIPRASMREVFAVLSRFDRYNEFYNPTVVAAKLLGESDGKQRFSMVMLEKAPFVTAAIESEYISQTTRIDARHAYSTTYSTRIQEIDNYGVPGQRKLPAGTGNGFLWRLYSIQRFEERDGGVYAEFEAIALSRDIPFALHWVVKPIVQHLPRNSMVATMEKTRDAVKSASASPQMAEAIKVRPPGMASDWAETATPTPGRTQAPR